MKASHGCSSSGQSAASAALKPGCPHSIPELANPEAIWHPIHPKSACRLHERVFVRGHDGFASRPTRWTPQINGPIFTLYHSGIWHLGHTNSERTRVDEVEQVFLGSRLLKHPVDADLGSTSDNGR
jgi:hypothetical protein